MERQRRIYEKLRPVGGAGGGPSALRLHRLRGGLRPGASVGGPGQGRLCCHRHGSFPPAPSVSQGEGGSGGGHADRPAGGRLRPARRRSIRRRRVLLLRRRGGDPGLGPGSLSKYAHPVQEGLEHPPLHPGPRGRPQVHLPVDLRGIGAPGRSLYGRGLRRGHGPAFPKPFRRHPLLPALRPRGGHDRGRNPFPARQNGGPRLPLLFACCSARRHDRHPGPGYTQIRRNRT